MERIKQFLRDYALPVVLLTGLSFLISYILKMEKKRRAKRRTEKAENE